MTATRYSSDTVVIPAEVNINTFSEYDCFESKVHAKESVNSRFDLLEMGTITKTCLFEYTENFTTKNENFQIKKSDSFHIFAQNIVFGYSLEPPRRGGSNEYPQSMFLSRNKKIMYTLERLKKCRSSLERLKKCRSYDSHFLRLIKIATPITLSVDMVK